MNARNRTQSKTGSVLRFVGRMLAGLLLLVMVCVGGGLLWVRTSHGERVLLENLLPVVNSSLAAQGLKVHAKSLSGPLPFSVRVEDVRVHDRHGEFFQADALSFRMALAPLFGGTVLVEEVAALGPRLARLPEIPPSPEPVESTPPVMQALLPVTVRLDALRVKEASIPAELAGLAGNNAGPETAPAPGLARPLRVNIDGSAVFEKGILTAAATLGLHLEPTGTTSAGATPDLIEGGFAATLTAKPVRVDISSAERNTVGLEALLSIKTREYEESLRLRLEAETDSAQAKLAALSLEGMGLTLAATGFSHWLAEVSPANAGLQGERVTAETAKNGVLPFGVNMRLQGEKGWLQRAERFAGVSLAALGAVADPLDIALRTEDKAGETRLVLERLHAGTIEGAGDFSLAESGGNPQGEFALEGTLALKLANIGAFAPAPKAGEGSAMNLSGPLKVNLAVEGIVPNLTTQASNNAGPSLVPALLERLKTRLIVESPRLETPGGPLEALRAELVTTVASLEAGRVDAGGSLRFAAREGTVGNASVQADWQITLPPVTETGQYDAPGSVSVSGLGLHAFGMQASGNLCTHLGPELLNAALAAGQADSAGEAGTETSSTLVPKKAADSPSDAGNARDILAGLVMPAGLWLEGDFSLQIADWAPLSGLAGTAIHGQGAAVAVRLASQGGAEGGSQGIVLDARLASLAMPESGISMDAAQINAEAAVPFRAGIPSLKLDAATGSGEAGGMAWKAIRATIGGDGRQGDFTANVLQDVARPQGARSRAALANEGKKQVQTSTAAAGKGAGNKAGKAAKWPGNNAPGRASWNRQELLSLSGTYDWTVPELVVQTLAAHAPDNGQDMAALRLRQPMRVSLVDGISVTGADIEFFPSGTVQADMQAGQRGIAAKLFVGDLPLDIVRRLSGADVPAGTLHAGLDASFGSREHPADPQATVRVEVRLDEAGATFEKHGKVRMRADADGTVNTRAGRGRGSVLGTAQDTVMQDDSAAVQGSAESSFKQVASSSNAVSPPPQGHTALAKGGANFPSDTPEIALEAAILRQGGRLVFAGGASLALTGEGVSVPSGNSFGMAPGGAKSGASELAKPLTFTVPLLVVDGMPQPDMQAPFKAALAWSGRVEKLWHLALKPDMEFSGLAKCDLAVSGTLAKPKTEGSAYLAGGRFYDKNQSVLLTDIQLEARASGTKDYFLALTATDGRQGTFGLEGKLELNEVPEFAIRGQARHLAPLNRDDVDLTFSGRFGASGSVLAPKITAAVIVERGEVALPSLNGPGVRTLEISDNRDEKPVISNYGPVCDITVDIPGRFHVRGFGLDSEWEGSMTVTGPLAEPELNGFLRPVRGFLELLSKPFAFSGGQIAFAGGTRINPGLDLELTYAGSDDIEAVIKTGGTLQRPSLELQSRPPLPQDEVLSRVLFGKSVSQLSRFEALQLANGMRELAGFGEGGFSPLTAMRRTVGLDVLRIGGGSSGEGRRQDSGLSGMENLTGPQGPGGGAADDGGLPSLEAGKYITDNIFIGIEQGATPESTGVRVEMELFPSVTVQGRTTSISSQAGVGWKMDY